MTETAGPPANPYVGPRAFESREAALFFGRDDEVRRLRSLVVSRRAVLLYAASGAGKSSLLRAGLLASLQRDYPSIRCLPVARVGGEPPAGLTPANPYAFQLLHALLGDRFSPVELLALSLGEGLRRVIEEGAADERSEGDEAVLLTIDQFEEVFTQEPHRLAERHAFFAELGVALATLPRLTLLLGIREDYLAQLDPYLDLLPDRLRSRFRLELLAPAAALAAITEPAARAGRSFAPDAARFLVDDLGKSRVQGALGQLVEATGAPVDPVQLQVVCHRLWEKSATSGGTIDRTLVDEHGKVDHALGDYYAERVAAAAARTGVDERAIRAWVGRQLITEQGIRGQVLRGAEETAGLPNAAVTALVDAHLVRAEPRRGAIWYELAHDRLIAAVREDNAEWSQAHTTLLESWVATWQSQQRPEILLAVGKDLILAEREAERLGAALGADARSFVAASQWKERQRRRRRRWLGWWLAVGSFLLLLVVAVAGALVSTTLGTGLIFVEERARAEVLDNLESHVDYALLAALIAGRHDQERAFPINIEPVSDHRQLLFQALDASSRLEILLHLPPATEVANLGWSPDGQQVIAVPRGGTPVRWEVATGEPVAAGPVEAASEPPAGPGGRVQSPDGRWLALSGERGRIELWEGRPPHPVATFAGLAWPARHLAFSPDGRWLASAHGPIVAIWQVVPGPSFFQTELNPPDSPARLAPAAENPPPVPSEELDACPGGVSRALEVPGIHATPSRLARVLACADGSLRVTDDRFFAIGPFRPLVGPVAAATALVQDEASGLVASGSANGEIWIWNLKLAKAMTGPLRGHRAPVTALAFARDGRELVSRSADGQRIRWNLDLDTWRARACHLAHRNPTIEEMKRLFYAYEGDGGPLCPGLPAEFRTFESG